MKFVYSPSSAYHTCSTSPLPRLLQVSCLPPLFTSLPLPSIPSFIHLLPSPAWLPFSFLYLLTHFCFCLPQIIKFDFLLFPFTHSLHLLPSPTLPPSSFLHSPIRFTCLAYLPCPLLLPSHALSLPHTWIVSDPCTLSDHTPRPIIPQSLCPSNPSLPSSHTSRATSSSSSPSSSSSSSPKFSTSATIASSAFFLFRFLLLFLLLP